MKRCERLEKLVQIGEMLRDKRMLDLRIAAAERDRSLCLLRDLNRTSPDQPQTIAEAQAALRYDRWADKRRAEINVGLAARTAVWLQARADAERTFGQAEVLRKLCRKQAGR